MNKRLFSTLLATGLILSVFAVPIINTQILLSEQETSENSIDKSSMVIVDNKKEESKNEEKPKEQEASNNQTVTFIVKMKSSSLLDTVINLNGTYENVADLLLSKDGKIYYDKIKKEQAVVKASIQKVVSEADFNGCYTYSATINGFTVKAPYNSIEKIKKINGVQDVILTEKKYTVKDNEDINSTDKEDTIGIYDINSVSKDIVNVNYAYNNNYTGEGILVAVLDNAFDCNHEVFSVNPISLKYDSSDINTLYSSVGFNVDNKYKVSDVHFSDKIVFAYDYANKDNNVYNKSQSHGTHIAGIIAGNNGATDKDEFKGIAYNAQLALMKIGDDNNAYPSDDTIMAALDDAVKIGADIINCSFGISKTGYGYTNNLTTEIYQKLDSIGIYVVAAVGNGSNNAGNVNDNGIDSSYIEYNTVNYPANIPSIMAVGSVDNSKAISKYFMLGDNKVKYNEIYLSDENNNRLIYGDNYFENSIDSEVDYIYIDAAGQEKDYNNIDVTDKIVILNQTELPFDELIETAYTKGAKSVIFLDNENTAISSLALSANKSIPVIVINNSYKEYLAKNPTGTVSSGVKKEFVNISTAGKVSYFSSYGVTADLKLKPDISAVGRYIYSAVNDNEYEYMSGTSMSSPCVAGTAAIIKQYLKNNDFYNSMTVKEKNNYISNLIMSTADVIEYSNNKNEEIIYYTPRLQGAGLLNLEKALSTKAYITVNGSDMAKAELGDSESGEYSFNFIIHNNSDTDMDYNLKTAIQSDKTRKYNNNVYNLFIPLSIADNAEIQISVDEIKTDKITVSANSSVDVTVNIKLKSDFIKSSKELFPYGFYVDGFIFLTSNNEDDVSLNIPFMGFCGNWSDCPIFDKSVYNKEASVINLDGYLSAVSESNGEIYNYPLGYNKETKETSDIFISKNSIKNFYDLEKCENSIILPNIYILRDACNYTITISDSDGTVLLNQNLGYVSSYVDSDFELCTDLYHYSENINIIRNLFANLENGTYTYKISAMSIGVNGQPDKEDSVSYKFIIDNTAPKSTESKTYVKNGKIYLTLSATDNNDISDFELYTATYNKTKNSYDYADSINSLIKDKYISEDAYSLIEKKEENGSTVFLYDITNLYSELTKLSIINRNNTEVPSALKIVYKAVDKAYNKSEPKTADTIDYGSLSLKFTDQNGKGVSGVKVMFKNEVQISNEKGEISFKDIMPDMYIASIISVPEHYETDSKDLLICINNKQLNIQKNIDFKYTGTVQEYSEISENISSDTSQNISSENSKESDSDINQETSADNTVKDTGDSSFYAVLFIGTLLIISVTSLLVSRQHSKR